MSYGPPPANPPGPPSGGYGPPPGGQPGGYSEPTQHGGAASDGQHSGPQGGQYGPPQGGQYSPPQGGQYGPPQGSQHVASHGGGRRSGFDPKSVNPLDWGLLAAGLIALIFSFFKYYEYKPKGADAKETCSNISSVPANVRGELQDACNGIGNSAWHGFFGWFGVLLALLGAILIALALFAPSVKLPVPTRIAAAGLFVLAALSTLIALFVIPDGDYKGQTIDSGAKDTDAGHGFSYWIVLVVVLIGAVLAIMRFLQTGGSFSDSFSGMVGKKGSTGSGTAYGQGYPAPAGGQPGYQQPVGGQPGYPQQYAPPPQSAPQPPPSGYQPPAAPPPSYQTPPASAPQPPPGYQQGPPPGYQPPPQQGPPPGYQPPPQQGPPPGYQPPPQQGPPPGYQPPPAQPGRDSGE